MEQVTFTITKEEIRNYSKQNLSENQIEQVLQTIESDEILWKNIRDSIISSINIVQNS